MLSMGAELGFSQGGNNNAYAQDNATTAIDWSAADASLTAFTARLIAARRANAALSRDAFLTGAPFDARGLPDVEWRDADAAMTQSGWNDPAGAVFVAVFAAPQGDGVDRVAVAMNRSNADTELCLPSPRAGMAWRVLIDTHDPGRGRAPARARRPCPVSCALVAHRRRGADSERWPRSGPPTVETIDKLASAAGVAAEWSDVGGKRTIVSPETKIALLAALDLDAASEAQARDSLRRLVDDTQRRRVPFSLVLPVDQPLAAPLRDMPRAIDARIVREDGADAELRIEAADGLQRELADGRSVTEREITLPSLPIGSYRLIVDDVECALTVAPSEAYGPKAALRKRFGVAAQLYALRRADEVSRDQGIGDFSALARAGEEAGGAGAAYLGVSPLHMLFPRDRARASPYYPSDRRFLDPIFIDALDDAGLPGDEALSAALASIGPHSPPLRRANMSSTSRCGARSARRSKHGVRRSRALARRDRAIRSSRTTMVSRDRAARACGASRPSRRPPKERLVRIGGCGRRICVTPSLRPSTRRSSATAKASSSPCSASGSPIASWGEPPRARVGEVLRLASIAISRSGRRRTAPNSWAHAGALARGVTIGAPPDPFSAQGQNWSLPALNPLAGAREGWASSSAVYRANMRHAGMLRIDHAMGLDRLFLIPAGAQSGGRRLSVLSVRRSYRPPRARKPTRRSAWSSARTSAPCRRAFATG